MGTPPSDQNGAPEDEPDQTGNKQQPLVAHEHDHEIKAKEDESRAADEAPQEEQGRTRDPVDRALHGEPQPPKVQEAEPSPCQKGQNGGDECVHVRIRVYFQILPCTVKANFFV